MIIFYFIIQTHLFLVRFSPQMSKNAAGTGTQVTLSIAIEITKMEN